MSFLAVCCGLVLTTHSCSDQNAEAASVPTEIRNEVEKIIKSKEVDSDRRFENFAGIRWNSQTIQATDSCIYPFSVVYERNGKKVPFKYRCITKGDSLFAITRFSSLSRSWVSILPKRYDVRNETWWTALEDNDQIIELTYDSKKLELLDEQNNSWREVYSGSVALKTNSITITADTLYWHPDSLLIIVPNFTLLHNKKEGVSKFRGAELRLNADFSSWTISNMKGEFANYR